MNSLRTLPTKALPLARTRFFSTSSLARKSAVDAATDTVKSVDRTISDAAVKGIEKGEQAAAKAKTAAGMGASKAEGDASQMAGEAKGKASEMAGEAKGKAQETMGAAKGKAEEVKGKM
ncbi:MAG: hypothetical protein LQ339_000650 [Xanthoria mediterranea]|nr:MAG: hypothetical protein LQ339_000650 [Xanthoria mediterranea]